MKIISIMILSSFLISCQVTPFPMHPNHVKDFFVIFFDSQRIPHCMKYEIVSKAPFKLKKVGEVDVLSCDTLGGLTADDMKETTDWLDDVYVWAEGRKKCFK